MNDLISRSELIKEIDRQIDDIIKDDPLSLSTRSTVFVADKVKNLINRQPTAYDIDKVVEELDNYLIQLVGRNAKLYTTVMEIVKAGRKNENE